MQLFNQLVDFIASTELYVKYLSSWPMPLNNPSFLAFVLIAFVCINIVKVFEIYADKRFHHRVNKRRKNARKKDIEDLVSSVEELDDDIS